MSPYLSLIVPSSSPILPTTDEYFARFVPIPPLEVQEEIVRILDNFTELTAELTARKKQYEYYRDTLLTFDENDKKKCPVENFW